MFIKSISIKNFRLLREVSLSLQKETTVIVGRNNSGKTALTEIFRRFFSGKSPAFVLEDFSLASMYGFKEALQAKIDKEEEGIIRSKIPAIELYLTIDYSDNKEDYGALSAFIIDFDDNSTDAKIRISYQLKDGKIDALFDEISTDNQDKLFEILKERIPKLFTVLVTAVDPTDANNTAIIDFSKLSNCVGIDFINAQRGLDDVTQSEKDVLGKVLSSIFKSATNDAAPPEMKIKTKELEGVVSDLQNKIDTDFKEKVDALLPALNLFGYPGLSDPNLSTETSLDVKTILESNTIIKYRQENGISLPETYNGLGSRNLIYILFKIFDFFRKYQSSPVEIQNHLIFIEEPEAHLHPQMQEVFIRKLYEIANNFSKEMNNGKRWPVQFVVSTHSTHIANEAQFDSIRYFLTKTNVNPILETIIKDLNTEFISEDKKEDKEFIHKYLTLTKCDLYFADKAMLIEGPTERILMPSFIKIFDLERKAKQLSSQYISIIEIGGAYAHLFYKFLDFLELKTLVITDLDSTIKGLSDKDKIIYTACKVSDGTHTSNAAIKNWFKTDDVIELKEIREKNDINKVNGYRRIAYQIPEQGKNICGRSFEDSFIIANSNLFNFADLNDKELEEAAFQKADEYNKKKTDFALQQAFSEDQWCIPFYIKEGLIWLTNASEVMEDQIN
jgi:putative ATP-dependent endonuclease of the OLD family